MKWFYAVAGKQDGPVSDSQLEELLRAGTINRQTLVWSEGMSAWQPLGVVRPSSPPPLPVIAPPVIGHSSGIVCAGCGQTYSSDAVIVLNGSPVCAACKPSFLQRIREGAAPARLPGPIAAAGLLWRTKSQLVTSSGATFPDRCVRCNAPANGYRLKRQLYWHPPAYYLLILLGLLIYAIVAICIRHKAVLHIGLCERHRVRRKWGIVSCTLGVLAGLGLFITGAVGDIGSLILPGILLFLGGVIHGVITGVRISPVKMTKEHVWLRGVNKDFLAELPELPGP